MHNLMYLYYLDTNECLPDSPCHANATCNNTEGSMDLRMQHVK